MSFTGLTNKDAPDIRTLVTRETVMACRLSFLVFLLSTSTDILPNCDFRNISPLLNKFREQLEVTTKEYHLRHQISPTATRLIDKHDCAQAT